MRAPHPLRRARRVAALAPILPLLASLASAQELEPLPDLAGEAPIDRTGDGIARVAWEPPADPVWPGQRPRLAVRVEVDARFLAEHVVQPFARHLDLPLAIDAPRMPTPLAWRRTGADAGPTLAFGGELVAAEDLGAIRAEDGAYRRAARIPLEVIAERPGEAELPALVLRFAAADTFRDELLGRVPEDARLAFVRGEPASFSVRRFPEDGHPPEFAGALGEFRLAVRVEPSRLRVGDTLRLVLDVDGPAQSGALVLPSAAAQHGLHLAARHVTDTESGWRVEEELVVESGTVREVRPLALWSFDPRTETYRVARTDGLPLEVTSPESPSPSEGGGEEGPAETRALLVALLSAGVVVLAAATVSLRRRKRAAPGSGRGQGRGGKE